MCFLKSNPRVVTPKIFAPVRSYTIVIAVILLETVKGSTEWLQRQLVRLKQKVCKNLNQSYSSFTLSQINHFRYEGQMSMTLLQSQELYSSPKESLSQKELNGDMTETLSSTRGPGEKHNSQMFFKNTSINHSTKIAA